MSLPSEDLEALVRYIAEECTPAEARAIEAKLASSSGLQRAADGLQHLLRERRKALHGNDIDAVAALAEVRAWAEGNVSSARRAASRQAPEIERLVGRRNFVRIAAVAASAALVLGGGWALGRKALGTWAVSHPKSYTDYITKRGELRRITLSDGTRVMLAADSRLRVTRFSATSRIVELTGEGYFEVAHDPSRPFQVRSARVETTVLGTEFGVMAYPDDEAAAVVVREGKVAVTTPGASAQHAVLARGMRAEVIGTRMQVATVDPNASLAWAHGELTFVNERVDAILKSIERWYDVRIEAEPELKSRRVEVSFANTSFDEGLEALAVALHARVVHAAGGYRLQAVAH